MYCSSVKLIIPIDIDKLKELNLDYTKVFSDIINIFYKNQVYYDGDMIFTSSMTTNIATALLQLKLLYSNTSFIKNPKVFIVQDVLPIILD